MEQFNYIRYDVTSGTTFESGKEKLFYFKLNTLTSNELF